MSGIRATRHARRPIALPLLVAGSLAGCAVGPDFHAPSAAVPAQFAGSRAVAGAPSAPPAAAGAPVDPVLWWRSLNDPELDSLVERALTANPGLEIALARLQEARTFEIAVTGLALPQIAAGSGGGRGTGTDLTRGGRVAGPLQSADHVPSDSRVTSISGGDLNWDIDLFGKFRREIEAARYDAQAAAAARDAVQVAVIADVVRAYVDLRGLQMQFAVLQQSQVAAQKLLDLVQARFDRGITNELDLTLAQRQYAAVAASLGPLSAQVRAAQFAIAVLLGKFPEELAEELAPPGLIPSIPVQIAAGIPVDLIRRRPDIRLAEWELAGATARIGVATANLFPQLSLGAGLGVQAQGFGYQPSGNQRIWSVGYSAVLPLLDFGTLDALVHVADLRTHEQLVNYKHTVQAAVAEVDIAMVSFQAQQQSIASLSTAVVASQRAMDLASERYDRGLSDFLNVVDAQRQAYELEGQYVGAEKVLAEQFVGLYRSLGGGWQLYAGPPALPARKPAIVAMFDRLLWPQPPSDPARLTVQK
jgi:NodT family efflux transporter outer membrane factor (OMF) lipoprotein